MTAQGMFVFLRQIRQTGFVAADKEGIRAAKIQALFELSERRCSTRGIISGERRFILFGECCGAVEKMPWLWEILVLGVLYSCASSVTTTDQWLVMRAKECW